MVLLSTSFFNEPCRKYHMSEISVRFKDMALLSGFVYAHNIIAIKVGKTSAITLIPHNDQRPMVNVNVVEQGVGAIMAFEPVKLRVGSKAMFNVLEPGHTSARYLDIRTSLACLVKANVAADAAQQLAVEPIAKFAEHGEVADAGLCHKPKTGGKAQVIADHSHVPAKVTASKKAKRSAKK